MNNAKPGLKHLHLPILLILLIGGIGVQTFISCSSGGGDDEPPPSGLNGGDPNTTTYTGTADGAAYTLKITKAANPVTSIGVASRSVPDAYSALYTAQVGDSYVLTVITSGGTIGTSSGTVTTVAGTLTLRPTGETTTFNITVNTTGGITHINGTITFSNGQTMTVNTTVTPGTGSNNPGGDTYHVTVKGGSGSGSYTAGAIVSITATVPSGQQFVNWTTTSSGVTFANANSQSTTFTMPSNTVTVTASFSGSWPPDYLLAYYGISEMPAPAGATDISWFAMGDGTESGLQIEFTGSQAADGSINSWFTSNGWILESNGTYNKPNLDAYYMRNNNNCGIILQKRNDDSWPQANAFADYGITGIPMPASGLVEWTIGDGVIEVLFTGSQATDGSINSWFTSNGWILSGSANVPGIVKWDYTKSNLSANYLRMFNSDESLCTIAVTKQ